MRRSVLSLLALLAWLGGLGECGAHQVTLAWDPSPDSTVTGYQCRFGPASGVYTNSVDMGNATTGVISNLVASGTYFFVVTAHDAAGSESDPSNEISYTVPADSCTITLAGLTQVYSGAPRPVTATTDPPGLPVTLTYNGLPNAPANAGSYLVVAAINTPSYTGSTTNTLQITQAPATVAFNNLNQTYSGAARAVTTTTTPPGLAMTLTYNGAANPPANAGIFTVIGTVNDPNYIGSATNTLIVNKAVGAIALGNLAQTYDGSAKAASASTTPAGLSVSLTYNGSTVAPMNAGTYVVAATLADPNYTGSTTGTLTIAKAGAGVTLNGLTQTFDGTPRSITASTTPNGLATSLTYNGAGAPPTAAGTYTVAALVSDSNYTGSTTGTLTVNAAGVAITLGNLSQTYDGTPKTVSLSKIPASAAVEITYNGAASAPVNVGSYAVVARASDTNCSGSAVNTLTIGKASATITLTGLTQTWDGSPKAVPAITQPAGLTVIVTYDGQTQPPVRTGTYAVNATIQDPNYSGSVTKSLMVKPGSPTIRVKTLTQAN